MARSKGEPHCSTSWMAEKDANLEDLIAMCDAGVQLYGPASHWLEVHLTQGDNRPIPSPEKSEKHTTLLRRPGPGSTVSSIDEELPGKRFDYIVLQEGDLWTVYHGFTGEVVYKGPGPVELVSSLTT